MPYRKTPFAAVVAALVLFSLPLAAAPAPAGMAPAPDPAAYKQEIERFRADRITELKDDQGWLTLVGLFWLEPGENKFGSDPAAAVVLPEGKAPAVAGTLVRDGRTVTVKVAPGVKVTSGGKPVATLTLADDSKGDPTVLELGTLRFHLVARVDRIGVRVKDMKSAALGTFRGLDNFPIQPDWRVVARWERSRPPKKLQITNVLGMVDEEISTGAVVFERDGQTYRLDALQHADGTMLIIFGDGTNGHETYNAGRFLEAVAPKDGQVVVDFNKAYNPPCAFTPYATCPLPPPENKLALRIPAGEKKYGSGTH